MAMQIFLFFALFIAILAIIFAIQNNADTSVSFFIWDADGSLALVLLVAMAIGALVSFLASLPANIKSRITIRNLRRKAEELEAEIHKYRLQLEEIQKAEPEPKSVEALPEPPENHEPNQL
jgi:uncharacterized integral membrane protein